VATRDPRFKGFAVLHGGVFPGGLGSNRVPGWFSTGDDDGVRTPAAVRQAAESVGTKATSIHFRTFPGSHALGGAEIDALIDWWLGE
jgi:predicted esterase